MEGNGGGGNRISENGVVMKNQRLSLSPGGIKFENPFAFKALQVFTGFGVGCGIGIGSGAPINLGSMPMVGEVMSAARGATNAFSGISGQVNNILWKLGAKNIKAGIGCGVGFGHGFGVGVAVKPSAIHKLQACLVGTASSLITQFGSDSKSSNDEEQLPNQTSHEPTSFGTRTEKVIDGFLNNPIMKQPNIPMEEPLVRRLESENSMLQMVMRHQKLIEELMEENEKLRRIIVEDLRVPPEKLEPALTNNNKYTPSPCSDCFECRRKQRRKR